MAEQLTFSAASVAALKKKTGRKPRHGGSGRKKYALSGVCADCGKQDQLVNSALFVERYCPQCYKNHYYYEATNSRAAGPDVDDFVWTGERIAVFCADWLTLTRTELLDKYAPKNWAALQTMAKRHKDPATRRARALSDGQTLTVRRHTGRRAAIDKYHRELCLRYFPEAFSPDGSPKKNLPDLINLKAITRDILGFVARSNLRDGCDTVSEQ